MGFISEEFRSLMLEIWKVKFLEMPRFGEVIRSIPVEIRLSHFLNDGDSPDIPIPVYVGYLESYSRYGANGVLCALRFPHHRGHRGTAGGIIKPTERRHPRRYRVLR